MPSPGSLSKPMLPPCASTISRETARPRPVPVIPVAPASPRKNFVKIRLCWSSGIPRPSSCTATRTPSPLRAGDELDGAAVGRVLDRVREQVTDDLGQSAGIAAHRQRPLRELDCEPVLRALRRVELRLLVEQRTPGRPSRSPGRRPRARSAARRGSPRAARRAGAPARRRSRGSGAASAGRTRASAAATVKPSTLASGVRSSWETMLTSSVFTALALAQLLVLRPRARGGSPRAAPPSR